MAGGVAAARIAFGLGFITMPGWTGRIWIGRDADRPAVKAQWAVLGQYDFVNIVEAPDEKTMARVSLELGSRGTARYESLVAIPIDEFIAAL